jgi:demethylsterigmatocystin 6-O-methyltransferase
MENIITQVRHLAKEANESERKQLLDSLKTLQYEIETPYDAIWRFGGLVGASMLSASTFSTDSNFFLKQLQISMARVGIDLGIFDALKKNQLPIGLATLAEKTGASPKLLGISVLTIPTH